MLNKRVSIIGLGHMGKAIAAGLIRGKIINSKNLLHSNGEQNLAAVKKADAIFITVRPKIVRIVAEEIRHHIGRKSIILCAAACVDFVQLEKYFGRETKIIRIMPNLPVAYGKGVIGWMGNKNVTGTDNQLIIRLLSGLGYLVKCKTEDTLDKLTVFSGSGPGYLGYIISKFEKSAGEFGFTEKNSREIILQMIGGTICQLESTGLSSSTLAEKVATKGGITEAIIRDLEENNFYRLLFNSMKKGYDKIGKIRKELRNGNN